MERTRQSLDSWDVIPDEMRIYFSHYGRHFNKKAYEFAVSQMYKINKSTGAKEYLTPLTKERYNDMLSRHSIKLQNDVLYDGMYVMSMAMADFLGSSIIDEHHLALFVKDYIDDPDQVDGFVFNRFYSDCVLSGTAIEWSDLL